MNASLWEAASRFLHKNGHSSPRGGVALCHVYIPHFLLPPPYFENLQINSNSRLDASLHAAAESRHSAMGRHRGRL